MTPNISINALAPDVSEGSAPGTAGLRSLGEPGTTSDGFSRALAQVSEPAPEPGQELADASDTGVLPGGNLLPLPELKLATLPAEAMPAAMGAGAQAAMAKSLSLPVGQQAAGNPTSPALDLELISGDDLSSALGDEGSPVARFINDLLPNTRNAMTTPSAPTLHAATPSDAAALASGSLSSAPSPTASSSAAPAPLPLHQPGFQQGLADRVVWMLNQQLPSAELRLNPAELGPLEVRVAVKDGEASVNFISAHGSVREAVQAALPQLRDMLAQQGIQLTQVNISQHGPHHEHGQPHDAHGSAGRRDPNGADGDGATETLVTTPQSIGLVDYYV